MATGPQSAVVAAAQVVGEPEAEAEPDPEPEAEPEAEPELEPGWLGEVVGVVCEEPGVLVGQAVVGLAATQAHRELTDEMTSRAVGMPQPLMTQFSAAFWMREAEAHWHS